MKIGFSKAPATPAGGYASCLAEVLERHVPGHEFISDARSGEGLDLYHHHGFRQAAPPLLRTGRAKSVVTVPNLNFLRYPHLYTPSERIFALRAYRRALQAAERLIALNTPTREELSARLAIPRGRIEVVMPLAALVPQREPPETQLDAVHRKYALPGDFMLMLGTVEPRHNHEAVLSALYDLPGGIGLVICGRRTAYSDFLLNYARAGHLATRVEFIYEPNPDDLPALFRLAQAFVYLPDAGLEASIVPVVEALRAGLPMLLSDTPLNREAAAEAALYVRPQANGELVAALQRLLLDDSLRRELRGRTLHRAEVFSEYAVAQRLIDIYSSL